MREEVLEEMVNHLRWEKLQLKNTIANLVDEVAALKCSKEHVESQLKISEYEVDILEDCVVNYKESNAELESELEQLKEKPSCVSLISLKNEIDRIKSHLCINY